MNGRRFSRKPAPTNMITDTPFAPALLRLLQLSSPALPVGAYAYSQGLEHAVCAQWVQDEPSAQSWMLGLLRGGLARLDVPVLSRCYGAWQVNDEPALRHWSAFLHASRESAELQQEDRHLGRALARLLRDLGMDDAASAERLRAGFAVMFALAAARWDIPLPMAAQAYLWTWMENQVAAAVKLVPLGQTAGQRILSQAVSEIPVAAEMGLALADDDIGFAAPGLAIGSALHETQYSRLFRS